MQDVKGQYIWILGASSGIGAALSRELTKRGAIVAISARREEKLEKLAATLSGEGHVVAVADVAEAESIRKAQEKILEQFPRIDSAIFMAAIYTPTTAAKNPCRSSTTCCMSIWAGRLTL